MTTSVDPRTVGSATLSVLFKDTSETKMAEPVTVSFDPRMVGSATVNVLFKDISDTNMA